MATMIPSLPEAISQLKHAEVALISRLPRTAAVLFAMLPPGRVLGNAEPKAGALHLSVDVIMPGCSIITPRSSTQATSSSSASATIWARCQGLPRDVRGNLASCFQLRCGSAEEGRLPCGVPGTRRREAVSRRRSPTARHEGVPAPRRHKSAPVPQFYGPRDEPYLRCLEQIRCHRRPLYELPTPQASPGHVGERSAKLIPCSTQQALYVLPSRPTVQRRGRCTPRGEAHGETSM